MKQCTCTPTDLQPFGECICGAEGSSRNFQKNYTEKEVITLINKFADDVYQGYYIAKLDVENILDRTEEWLNKNLKK